MVNLRIGSIIGHLFYATWGVVNRNGLVSEKLRFKKGKSSDLHLPEVIIDSDEDKLMCTGK